MKRTVWLILMMLLASLAYDGFLGKAALLPSDFSADASLTSLQQYDSGNLDSHLALTAAACGDLSRRWQFQPVTLRVQSTLKIITYCHTNSSGGIPL